MSRPGYLLINSQIGKQSELLVASDRLKNHLQNVARQRKVEIADIYTTNNLYVTAEFKPHVKMGHEYLSIRPKGADEYRLTNSTTAPVIRFDLAEVNGDFMHDAAVRIIIKGFGDSTAQWPRYRYCNLPGARLFRKVSFEIDKKEIDSYKTENMLFYDKTDIGTDSSSAWLKCLGQQSKHDAKLYMPDWQIEQHISVTDGAQTFRSRQADLELFIPLIFWFNHDVTQSFQMNLMGGLQKAFEIELNKLSDIIQAVNADGSINTTALTAVDLSSVTLFVKNLFIDPVIYDVLTLRKTLTLMRMRRTQETQLTIPTGDIQLRQLKYPIESLIIGFRPNVNTDPANPNSPTRWTEFSAQNQVEIPIPTLIQNPLVAPTLQLVVRTAAYDDCQPVVHTLGLSAHGSVLYPLFPAGFYNQYMSYYFPDFVSSDDCGVYSIHFNMYYRKYNPSGHYDSSRARELILKYTGDYISTNTPTTMYCEGRVINFLWASGDTITLRYMT